MPYTAEAVRVGTTGDIYVAPKGTAAPADTTTAWAAAWKPVGAISEDGVTLSPSTDHTDFRIWQSTSPIRTQITGSALTLQFVAVETNDTTIGLFFPGSTTTTTSSLATTTISATPAVDERAFGFEWVDGLYVNRLVIARGMVTDMQDLQVHRTDLVGYGMTVSAYASGGSLGTWLRGIPA